MMTNRHLNDAVADKTQAQRNLTSGFRINSASDDAAGLQISNNLHVQNRGLDIAIRNANDAYSLAETAEGAIQESSEMLQRLRSLGLQAANGSMERNDREAVQVEVEALNDELNRIANTSSFGEFMLFNGSFDKQSFNVGSDGNSISLALKNMQTNIPEMGGKHYLADTQADKSWRVTQGADELNFTYFDPDDQQQSLSIKLKQGDDIEQVAMYINAQQSVVNASVTQDRELQLFSSTLNVADELELSGSFADEMDFSSGEEVTLNDIDMTTAGGAQLSVAVIDAAIKYVDSHRSEIGSFQNRIEGTLSNLDNVNRSISASKGRIRDADFAYESTQLVRSQVLHNATEALFSQARQSPSSAISLLS